MNAICLYDVVPYDQSGAIKTPELVNLNYTCQDFWSLKARLRDFIKERFADEFSDFVESSLAIMLIENWAFCADLLSFKLDQIANEIFIDTVSEIDNAFRLAMLVGYKPRPPIAARSFWSATITNLQQTDVTLPTPVIIDIVTEQGPSSIELFPADSNNLPMFEDDIVIPAGHFTTTAVIGLEGRTRNQTNIGTGQVNQFYQLAYGPVVWDSVRVSVDGIAWTQVDYFTDSQPRREFRVEYDASYNAYVMFGNNRAGLIPSEGSSIAITYRTGGGVAGNIVTGSVEVQRNYPVPGFGYLIPVTLRNYTRGEFGYNGDTIEDIKRNLPAYMRTQDRIVSPDDWHTFANQFATPYSGIIGKATATVRHRGCAANIIDLYVLARDGENGLMTANDSLKQELKTAIEDHKMMSETVCIRDGVVIEVDVQVDVTMAKFYRKFEDEYRAKIATRIAAFFSLNRWDYGQDLLAINLAKELVDIKEVMNASVTFMTDNPDNSGERVAAKFYEIIRPQDLTLAFVYD